MPFDGYDPHQEVTDLLIAGRDKIKAGWCKGYWDRRRLSWRGVQQQYCMLGALRAANGRADALYWAAHQHLHNAMEALFAPLCGMSIPYFQDRPERRKRDVLRVYDLAIELSKEAAE